MFFLCFGIERTSGYESNAKAKIVTSKCVFLSTRLLNYLNYCMALVVVQTFYVIIAP